VIRHHVGMRAWLIIGIALIVVGAALYAVTTGTVPQAMGFALAGLGAVLLTGLLFYAVGRSEDRAREAERRPPH
jgi:predicted permease